jgi:hypothetical protein
MAVLEEATVGLAPPLPLRFAPGRFAALRSATRPALDTGQVPALRLLFLRGGVAVRYAGGGTHE